MKLVLSWSTECRESGFISTCNIDWFQWLVWILGDLLDRKRKIHVGQQLYLSELLDGGRSVEEGTRTVYAGYWGESLVLENLFESQVIFKCLKL